MNDDNPMRAAFNLTSRPIGSTAVLVEIAGDLDAETVPQTLDYLVEVTARAPDHLIVDLSELRFISSTGMALLLTAHDHDKGVRGQLHLLGVIGNRHVERPLALMSLLEVFDIAPDLQTLLAGLAPGVR